MRLRRAADVARNFVHSNGTALAAQLERNGNLNGAELISSFLLLLRCQSSDSVDIHAEIVEDSTERLPNLGAMKRGGSAICAVCVADVRTGGGCAECIPANLLIMLVPATASEAVARDSCEAGLRILAWFAAYDTNKWGGHGRDDNVSLV